MVFMIKLPPGQTIAPVTQSRRKDDRISLLKSRHRPYGNSVSGVPLYGQEANHPTLAPCQSTRHSNSDSSERVICLKQQLIIGATIIIVFSLLVFVVFITTFRKVPNNEPFKFDGVLEAAELPSSRGEVAVKTTCGHVIGKSENGAYVFKGIAYAKPPVGNLRWRKPVPLWVDSAYCEEHHTQEAFSFGSKCFQLNPYSKKYEGSEDCLFLNIWSPSLDISKGGLEVMVWVHGGFLQFGSGNEPGLAPSAKLAQKLNVVFVSLNYRLYTLGFLALEMLSSDILTDSRGNYGLWDQLCALQWIKDNIRNFGGNPKKITLFGPDAGAASIMSLMVSPKAQGLFRSSWLIGPTMLFNRSFEDVTAHNKGLFLHRSKCKDPECLRKCAPQEIIAAHLGKDDASFRIRDQNDLPIQGIFPEQLIVIDGDLLIEEPSDGISEEKSKNIPLLIGSAAQAVDFWPGPDDLSSWTWGQYKKYVTTSLDSFAMPVSQMALQIYNGTAAQLKNPNYTAEFLYTSMVSDIRQTCPVNSLAHQLAWNSRSPVYRYITTAKPSSSVKIFNYTAKYSFHMWDVIAFFGDLDVFLESPGTEDAEFSDTVQKTVMSFVKSNGEKMSPPDWLRYPKRSANLDKSVTYGNINKTECKFWLESKLEVYAWVS